MDIAAGVRVDIAAGVVVTLLALLVVGVVVGAVVGAFIWAAVKDGQEDKALRERLGKRRRTRFGRLGSPRAGADPVQHRS